MLHLDGTIEVCISASGYLQGTFWDLAQGAYGTRIQDTTSLYLLDRHFKKVDFADVTYLTVGSVHDHVINFKVAFGVITHYNLTHLIRCIHIYRSISTSPV